MAELFSIQSLMTLLMLIMLQAVLGFDNLLYISLESKRVAESEQQRVRRIGIGLAIALRIILLLVVVAAISKFQNELFGFETLPLSGHFTGHSLIVLFGGVFILYTAVKEIFHMLSLEDAHNESNNLTSASKAIFWIVVMNLIFSFDSILSAMAIAEKDASTGNFPIHSVIIMASAVIISGILMIVMSDTVSNFLKKNRMYEVLGLFVLFIVGILLISEGGHLAHIKLFNHEVHAMQKSTFYFVLVILVMIDIVQSRYQRKLLAQKAHRKEPTRA